MASDGESSEDSQSLSWGDSSGRDVDSRNLSWESSAKGMKFCIGGHMMEHDGRREAAFFDNLEGIRRRKKQTVNRHIQVIAQLLTQVTGDSMCRKPATTDMSNESFKGMVNPRNGLPIKMSL
mmetsp:Transcript_159238/g.281174  ORF Transcript_159238/g.281174 Transcript_159238/m.281174 type:complete len:122 (-) Transcript_159238:124-489(-)